MGRRTTYTEAIAREIVDRLAAGEPLAQICRDDHMPGVSTVYDWQAANADFAGRFTRARADGFDAIAVDALRIADTPQEGVETKISDDGVEERRGDMLGHRRLQVETRLKLLAKWDPKRYGDRQHVEHSGKVGLESLVAGDEPSGE